MIMSSLASGLVVVAGCRSSSTGRPTAGTRPESAEPLPDGPRPIPSRSSRARVATGTRPSGVIARNDWTSQGPIYGRVDPMNGISRITVHHDGMAPVSLRTKSQAARRIEVIRHSHVESRGWGDIGYHYIIDPQGRIWEGRPIAIQGAHVKDNNEHNIGILVLGNFDSQHPSGSATGALEQFLANRMRAYNLGVRRVWTHRELRATACPGRNLQRYMEHVRSRGGGLASV
jgi:hypothetical protein